MGAGLGLDSLERSPEPRLAGGTEVLLVLGHQVVVDIEDDQAHEPGMQLGGGPVVDEARLGAAHGTAEQRRGFCVRVFQVARNVPRIGHRALAVDQHRDASMTAELYLVGVGEGERAALGL